MGSNCAVSASIGCLFCFKGCSPEKLRNMFTFIPPPPSYSIKQDGASCRLQYTMDALCNNSLYQRAAEHSEVRWVTTRRGSRVPVVWLSPRPPEAPAAPIEDERPQEGEAPAPEAVGSTSDAKEKPPAAAGRAPIVLLHCHGNATDIDMMMVPYHELSTVLGVEVVGVEYSGYGAASGKPSAAHTLADVEAAYDYVVSMGVPPNRIVAYGQSVGSGPVSSLASKRPLGGVVLHSPLLSGIKVIDPQPDKCCRPSCVFHCFDFYPNDRRLKSVDCPVFVMHGQKDDVVPFYHGDRLSRALPNDSRWKPYFPRSAGHNDIAEQDKRMYFGEVSNFLIEVQKRAKGGAPGTGPPASAASDSSAGRTSRGGGPSDAGIVERPSQVEMTRSSSNNSIPGVRVVPGPQTGLAAMPPPRDQRPSGNADRVPPTQLGEPAVGPEDGRYQRLRQGDVREVVIRAGDSGAQAQNLE